MGSHLYRTRYERVAFRKADTRRLTVESVLTWPVHDLAGDYVEPAGLNFAPHERDPSIDLEHSRTTLKGFPIAWARDSLAEPGGKYAVEMLRFNLAGQGEPDEYHTLPVGTNYFDPSCPVSSQAFALAEQGALPAVSLEFTTVPGYLKSLGRSPLEDRDAYHFHKVNVHRWTLCGKPVNPGALHVGKAVPPVPEPLAKILADRRVNVGGRHEPLHGYILKALVPPGAAPVQTTKTTVRVEKAMEDENEDFAPVDAGDTGYGDADMQTPVEADVEGMMPEESDAPAANGVTAIFAHVQMLLDAKDQLEADAMNSDNPDLIREVKKLAEVLGKHAEKVKAVGDKHDAKLAAVKGGTEEPEVEDEPAAEPDGDEYGGEAESPAGEPDGDEVEASADDAEADDDDDDKKPFEKSRPRANLDRDVEGVLKAVRSVYLPLLIKKALPRTLAQAEVKKAREDAKKPKKPSELELRAAAVAGKLKTLIG